MKRGGSLVFCLLILSSLSCSTLPSNSRYYNAVKEARSGGQADFVFLELRQYLQDYPDSRHSPEVKFAICDYYFQTKNYRQAIEELKNYILKYPDQKNIVFAQALLYKIVADYKNDANLVEKLKGLFFSKSVFLIFSESEIKSYRSALNNTYKIADYVDRIEVFRNGDLFFKITP